MLATWIVYVRLYGVQPCIFHMETLIIISTKRSRKEKDPNDAFRAITNRPVRHYSQKPLPEAGQGLRTKLPEVSSMTLG